MTISSSISMGLSSGEKDFGKRESEVALIGESREMGSQSLMDMHNNNNNNNNVSVDIDADFWPVEHPMEPQDEDRPVKCPIPTSSLLNDGRMQEERHGESLRKRAEVSKQGIVRVGAEPPVGAVRKRHHTLTNGEHVITPLTTMPSLPSQNVTIFQMLQQLDEFES